MDEQPPIWEVHPLLGTMWKTMTSRFHAAGRLRTRSWWKGIALSILSGYVLVLSVVPKFVAWGHEGANQDYIGLITVAASILILVFSVVSIFDEDNLRSNYMQDNAKSVSSIYREYKLSIEEANQDGQPVPPSEKVNDRYQAVLERCPFNHDPIDWLKTRIDILVENKKIARAEKFKLSVWLFYDIYFWPILAISSPWVLGYFLLVLKWKCSFSF